MDLSPERIFTLFFKYPMEQIPIASGNKIHAFISKKKTIREASSTDFFQTKLEDIFERILSEPTTDDFFQSLPQNQRMNIPVVDWDTLKIRIISKKQFSAEFQPVQELEDAHFKLIVDESDFPFFVVNSKKEIIYKNKNMSKLTKLFLEETGTRRQSILDYLPENFFPESIEPKKTYTLKMKSHELKYKIQQLLLDKGNVEVVSFFY